MKILIVDDESDIVDIVEYMIQDKFSDPIATLIASSGNEAIKILGESRDIDVCICDHNMAGGMGSPRFLEC